MNYELLQTVPLPPYPNFHIYNARGECAFITSGKIENGFGVEPGTYLAECTIPGYLLNSGTYFIGLALTFSHKGIHVSFLEKDALGR